VGEARLPAGKKSRLGAALLFAALGLLPAQALAHASLVKSSPPQRATLHRAPQKIELCFNERLEPRYSSFTVVDAKDKAVETGPVEVAADEPRRLSAAVKSLGPGRYTVRYRVLSTDGHIVQGSFAFIVRQ